MKYLGFIMTLAIIGCATSTKITATKDGYDDAVKYCTADQPLEGIELVNGTDQNAGVRTWAEMMFCKVKTPNKSDSYPMFVTDPMPIHLQPKDSLQFRIDGQEYKFSTGTDAFASQRVLPGVVVPNRTERLLYDGITREFLVKLTTGHDIRIKAVGARDLYVGTLKAPAITAIANLLSDNPEAK